MNKYNVYKHKFHICSLFLCLFKCLCHGEVCDSLSVTCGRSVVFCGTSNKADSHDITEILIRFYSILYILHAYVGDFLCIFFKNKDRKLAQTFNSSFQNIDICSVADQFSIRRLSASHLSK